MALGTRGRMPSVELLEKRIEVLESHLQSVPAWEKELEEKKAKLALLLKSAPTYFEDEEKKLLAKLESLRARKASL